ncbi:ATP-binding cassette sub-family C member 3-like [Macrobrachium rosenbergii]|uniref:ATP-binding cassette sub-family C member 3-like n=1 Tax=Macrobrachium rosenbergii TaxID=79674 RepID=UPI0034D56AFF
MNNTDEVSDSVETATDLAPSEEDAGETRDRISKLCGSPFWNASLSWDGDLPDMGICMERTVLIWGPCILLWALAPLQVYLLRRRGLCYMPWTCLRITKVVISVLLIVIAGAELIWALVLSAQGFPLPSNEYLAPVILMSSYTLQLGLVLLGRHHGEKSSGVIYCFWAALVVCGVPQFITTVLYTVHRNDQLHVLLVVTFLLQYIGAISLFIVNCFVDNPPESKWFNKSKSSFPEYDASFISRMTFHWANGMVWRGYKTTLKADDLWELPSRIRATNLDREWDIAWQSELSAITQRKIPGDDVTALPKVSVLRVLLRLFFLPFFMATLLYVASELMVFATPRLLSALISFTTDGNEPAWHGYLYALLLMLITLLTTFVKNIFYYIDQTLATQLRSTIMSAVYRKALVLSNSSRRESTVGEIVNLMSIDSQRLSDTLLYINLAWGAPIVISLALYELWQLLGPSVLSGLAVLILLIPINSVVANKIKNLQTSQMKFKDKRIKLLNEIINGIKVLKLYAWEGSFAKQVEVIRKDEISVLRKSAYFQAFASFVWLATPYLVALGSFATFVMVSEENVLDAKTAFVAISLFNIMRMPITQLPASIAQAIQANVALKRLGKYFGSSNIDLSAVCQDTEENSAVAVHGGQFSWGAINDEEPWTLKNIDMTVSYKSLVAVVGSVGSGKSSLFSALLGEMQKEAGRVIINGRVAYVSQQAWLQNATLKDNIIWGEPLDEEKYRKVIEACALLPDLEMLPGGDLTEIGEKGINLSGGQKQRISLARAAYSNAEIILLDDPLSAVDAHVGRHIFQNLIGPKGLMTGKTRILVTHAIWVLPQVDEIFVVRDGSVVERGTYNQLLSQGGNFAQFLLQHINTKDSIDEEDNELDELCDQLEGTPSGQALLRQLSRHSKAEDGRVGTIKRRRRNSSTGSSRHHSESENELTGSSKNLLKGSLPADGIKSNDAKKNGQILIHEEKVEIGKVKWKVYQFYAQSIGLVAASLPIIFYIIAQVCQAGSNVWLAQYSSESTAVGNETMADFDRTGFLLGYGGFGIGQSLFFYLGSLVTWTGTMMAGKNIHKRLLENVLCLPMKFFDTNPSGRVMNRMSKEMDVLDSVLPMLIGATLTCFAQVLTTLIVIIASTPIVLVVILPVTVAYYYIQKIYISTARQIKRLESLAKSPIFSYFSESLQGVSLIRAFKKQDDFVKECQRKVDYAAKAFVTNLATNRWLLVRLECLGNLITFAAAIFAVSGRETMHPGVVGLSITYALNVTVILNWLVRMTAEVEANIVSVERIREYIEEEQEAPWKLAGKEPAKSWPDQGCITFSKYEARYRPGLELVIKGISCKINPGEKVGIVGRTGAGKSSLTLCLFRIVEAAGGSIDIDGKDISKIGLHDLRGRLSIIPQDPVLFSGPLRINLDPFSAHSDEEVWQALENAHLKDYVKSQTHALHTAIDEGGANLSVGQRQLVCLARALLRKSKILVLDEATAAVDLDTDDLIQATIRKEFADCTILTIAHRLNNIMGSDRVMVMDKGKIAEFSSPSELLSDKNSIFYGMAKDAGLV